MTRRPAFIALLLATVLAAALAPALAAAQAPPATEDPIKVEQRAASRAVEAAAKPGPIDVPLLDQAHLRLPKGMAFVPAAEANRLLRAMGNQTDDNLVGAILPEGDAAWLTTIEWTKSGYIRDNEPLNADEILGSLREGTEAGNEDRRARGFPELEVKDWVQPPRYDQSQHQLAWAVPAVEKGGTDASVNFNTRALGRDGYFSLTLLDEPGNIDADRPAVATMLSGLEYNSGKRYTDFNDSTDHVAEFGLAALIGVVAAKKLGLIALAGMFLLKFAKIAVLAVVGLGVALRRMFRRRPAA